MADPEPRASERASEAQARASRAGRDSGRGPAENRVFEQGTETARRAADASVETARDVARAGAEASRQFAETGSRVVDRGADLWRQSMFPLTTFSYEMNRLFDQFWRTAVPAATSLTPLNGAGAGMMQGLMGMPCADLHETADAYHISVELPGMRAEQVEVLIDGDALLVRGEKQDTHSEERGGFRVNERRFGRFERRFHLPRDADREKIQAQFRNGVLEIQAARRAGKEDARKRIEVRSAPEGGGPAARR